MSILIKTDNNKWTRRALLKGMGIGAASSLLPVLEADAQETMPKRVIIMTTPNGIAPEVEPVGSQTDWQFGSAASTLNDVRADITYLRGIDLKTWTTNRIPNDHPPVIHQLLTASDSIDPMDGSNPAVSGSWLASGQSIDQFLADRLMADPATQTRFRSIVAGVDCGRFAWQQVYRQPGEPIFPENNAGNLHARIFEGVSPGGGQPDPALLAELARRKSVVDSVKDELNAVLSRVGSADKQKIESHINAIREIEQRLDFDQESSAGAACEIPDLRATPGSQDEQHRLKGTNMMDIIANALACDQTRVATLQWANGASGIRFTSLGINEAHHDITHDNFNANAGKRAQVAGWYAERFKYLIQKLKSIPEGGGSVLDNSVILWTTEHNGRQQHGRTNVPFFLAGGLGGAFNTGQFLDFSNNTLAHNDVYVSLAQGVGLSDVTSFGKASLVRGPVPGLLA